VAGKRNKAAALKYEVEEDSAPRVVAKGRNTVAEKIVETAMEAKVPIVEDAALVSALLALELGEEIPPDLYRAVAKILSFLYNIDRLGKTGGRTTRSTGRGGAKG
jgi:flagellar biosynthesis protein